MTLILDPFTVAAGIAVLTNAQAEDLNIETAGISGPLQYMAAISSYLLGTLGPQRLREAAEQFTAADLAEAIAAAHELQAELRRRGRPA